METSIPYLGPDGEPADEGPPKEPARSIQRIWYRAPDGYRFDRETLSPALSSGEHLLFVNDGEYSWRYQPSLGTFTKGRSAAPLIGRSLLYPAAGNTLTGLLEGFRSSSGHPDVKITGEESMLGRRVYVIEARRAFARAGSGLDETSESAAEDGVIRMWVDAEYFFPLRLDLTGDGGNWEMRYTSVQFNVDVPDDLFHFSPPPGAMEVERCQSSHSSSGVLIGNQIDLPDGFLMPALVPAGYESRGSTSSSDNTGVVSSASAKLLEKEGDGYLVLREVVRKDGFPPVLQQGDRISIKGSDAWSNQSDGVRWLAWREHDIAVQLLTNDLTVEQLIDVAESMEPYDGPGETVCTHDDEPQTPEPPRPLSPAT